MACEWCKKVKANEEREKARKLAASIAEKEGRTQILIEFEGKLSIECEACWVKGGRKGEPLEYFII